MDTTERTAATVAAEIIEIADTPTEVTDGSHDAARAALVSLGVELARLVVAEA